MCRFRFIESLLEPTGSVGTLTRPGSDFAGHVNTELIDFLGKSIVVRSADPFDPQVVAGTIITAPNQQWQPLIVIQAGELSGVTVTSPGPFHWMNDLVQVSGDATVRRCVIRESWHRESAAPLKVLSGSPLILECAFQLNYGASTDGSGGVVTLSGSPSIVACSFVGNVNFGYGGAA